jgi:hypothetical protein
VRSQERFSRAEKLSSRDTAIPPRPGQRLDRTIDFCGSPQVAGIFMGVISPSAFAIDVVGIAGREELLAGRYVVFRVPFHLYAPLGSLLSGILCPSIQTTG